jgi:type I restriction enzyme S subunit
VAKIEQLAAKIEEARAIRRDCRQELGRFIHSVVNATFANTSTDSQCIVRPLNSVAEVARGKFTHRPRNEPRFYGGDYPFIQIGDISNANRYVRSYSQSLNREGFAISRMFPSGTVIIAITGATIGVTAILGFDSCFPDSIVGLIPREGLVTSEFLYYALEHEKWKALRHATQTTQPNINLKNLNALSISLPSIREQQRIVASLDDLSKKVDALKAMQSQAAAELDALLPSILDRAFKGEL